MEPATLVEALASLTDSERLDFARWASSQPHPPAVRAEWGDAYIARSASEDVAARAFDVLRNDGTVPHPWPWDFYFDPCFPETGWEAWKAAKAMVRAMAEALAGDDGVALDQLGPAFERLGLRVS